MQRHDIDIQIGDYSFSFVESVEVNSGWELLTDTCTITVPRKLQFEGETIAQGESLFNRGDAVTVRLGYDGAYQTVFQGYVARISPGIPLTFECEDLLYLAKRSSFTKSYRDAKLSSLLADMFPGLSRQSVEADLGQLRIANASPAKVLKRLQDDYGIYSWARNGKLYSGLAYWPELSTTHNIVFDRDVIKQSSSLEYQGPDDVPIRVRAVSMLPDNSKLQAEVGDPTGDLRTLYYYNVTDQPSLKDRATADLERYRYEGYRGHFTTFGTPQIQHGDVIALTDKQYPDRSGSYLVKSVRTMGGRSGYRQRVEMDIKV